MILSVGRICPPACREGEAGGSVGADDEFAEGSLAEGGQSRMGLPEREYLLTVTVIWPVATAWASSSRISRVGLA